MENVNLQLKSKIWKLKREIEGVYKKGNNPHFRSTYVTLNDLMDEIDPVCDKLNLIYSGDFEVVISPTGNPIQLFKLVITDGETGAECEHEFLIDSKDIQKTGGAITYARRYLLVGIFGLQAIDLDAEDVMGRNQLNPPSQSAAQPTRKSPFRGNN